jgi:hypothetical protein
MSRPREAFLARDTAAAAAARARYPSYCRRAELQSAARDGPNAW